MTPAEERKLDLLRRLYRHVRETGFGRESEERRREVEDLFAEFAEYLKGKAPRVEEERVLVLHTDGGSRGNPGPAGAGGVILDGEGRVLEDFALFLGTATNNEAEYRALIEGLRRAAALKPTRLVVRMDSLLVVKQMRGEYRVKDRKLLPLHLEARRSFPPCPVLFEHIPRERNALADRLANRAMDQGVPAAPEA